jgi:hypothetical protein
MITSYLSLDDSKRRVPVRRVHIRVPPTPSIDYDPPPPCTFPNRAPRITFEVPGRALSKLLVAKSVVLHAIDGDSELTCRFGAVHPEMCLRRSKPIKNYPQGIVRQFGIVDGVAMPNSSGNFGSVAWRS